MCNSYGDEKFFPSKKLPSNWKTKVQVKAHQKQLGLPFSSCMTKKHEFVWVFFAINCAFKNKTVFNFFNRCYL